MTDFIDFIHFPAFNVADAAINVGVAAIVIALLFSDLIKRNPRSPLSDRSTPAMELMADQDGERLDQFLARRLDGASRTQARQLIDDGLVRVDGSLERPAYKLSFGDFVVIYPAGVGAGRGGGGDRTAGRV